MHQQYFFGYGSLVNQRTHSYPQARPAKLTGWRRLWCHTELSDQVFLSAHPVPDGEINGLMAEVPDQDWQALDLRERGYQRHDVTDQVDHDHPQPPQVQVYAIPRDLHVSPTGGHILLSYLDVVVQGFVHHYGAESVAGFFDSTDGWDRTVLNDRAAPRYPRHQQLNAQEIALVDRHLDRLPVRIRPAPASGW